MVGCSMPEEGLCLPCCAAGLGSRGSQLLCCCVCVYECASTARVCPHHTSDASCVCCVEGTLPGLGLTLGGWLIRPLGTSQVWLGVRVCLCAPVKACQQMPSALLPLSSSTRGHACPALPGMTPALRPSCHIHSQLNSWLLHVHPLLAHSWSTQLPCTDCHTYAQGDTPGDAQPSGPTPPVASEAAGGQSQPPTTPIDPSPSAAGGAGAAGLMMAAVEPGGATQVSEAGATQQAPAVAAAAPSAAAGLGTGEGGVVGEDGSAVAPIAPTMVPAMSAAASAAGTSDAAAAAAVAGAAVASAASASGNGGAGFLAGGAAGGGGGGINLGALPPSLMEQIAAVAAAATGVVGPAAAPLPNLFDASKPAFNLLDILVRCCAGVCLYACVCVVISVEPLLHRSASCHLAQHTVRTHRLNIECTSLSAQC